MKKFKVTVNGQMYEVEVEEVTGSQIPSPSTPIKVGTEEKKVVHQLGEKIVAPMPGKIVAIKVNVGQVVKEGDLVAVLEAMKMENEIFATASGTVLSVDTAVGAAVESQEAIVTVG